MYESIFYEGLQIKAEEPIDQRMYVESLTVAELERIFENDGRYSFDNIVVFNKADKKFYYLNTRNVTSDALIPGNWNAIESNAATFTQYAPTGVYNVGNCVYETDGGGNQRFFIARSAVDANESPLTTPNKWLEVKGEGTPRQKVLHRLNPTDIATYEFEIDVAQVITLAGNYPNYSIYVDLGERDGANIVWETIEPQIKTKNVLGTTKLLVKFSGDMTDVSFNAVDTSQTNILIEIR